MENVNCKVKGDRLLFINNPNAICINVFDINGACVYNNYSPGKLNSVCQLQDGEYLVVMNVLSGECLVQKIAI